MPPDNEVEWNLSGVRAAPSQDLKHLGLGTFLLVEAQSADGTPTRAVLRSFTGHESAVSRVAVSDPILTAIDAKPEVKVARCSASGEPSSAYILCEASVVPEDARASQEFRLRLSLRFRERVANRIKPGEHTILQLKPIKAYVPAPPAPPATPPAAPDPSASPPSEAA